MEWKLLFVFLQYPDRGFYTQEIARQTGISVGTVNNFLHNIQKDGILSKDIIGNIHLYKLNNEHEIIKHLKIVYVLLEIEKHQFTEQLLKIDGTVTSIILYGSCASGQNDSKSDIDLLILSNNKKSYISILQTLEKKMNKQINLQQMTLFEWQKLKEKDKIFYESILEKNIVLYGSGLP